MTAVPLEPARSRLTVAAARLRGMVGARTAPWRDGVLLGLFATASLTTGWQLLELGPVAARVTGFAGLRLALDLAFLVLVWRVVRTPGTPRTDSGPARSTRLFWLASGASGLLMLAGDGMQLVAALRTPTLVAIGGTGQVLPIAAGAMCWVFAIANHPIRLTGPRLVRYRVDAGLVVVATTMFVWYAGFSDRAHGANPVVLLGGSALTVLCALGLVRLGLAGTPPITRLAGLTGTLGLALLAVSAALSPSFGATFGDALGPGLSPAQGSGGHPDLALAAGLLSGALLAATPRIFARRLGVDVAPSHGRAMAEASPRRSHLVIYACVTAAQVLLVVALGVHDVGARGGLVVIGAVAITALVLARQHLGIVDQSRLTAQLEAAAGSARRREHRWSAMAEHATEITCVVDADGRLAYASPAIERVLGYSPGQVSGEPISGVVHPDDAVSLHRTFAELIAAPGASRSADLRMRRDDGSWRWLRAVGTNLLHDPDIAGVVCNARDVTETLRFSDQLRYEATHDPLTRLANRAQFAEQMRTGGSVSRGITRETMSIMVIDLDDFRAVNESLGQDAGDALLTVVAGRLLGCARSMDTVARTGGDEFAVLLPATTTANGAVIVERVLRSFAEPALAAGRPLPIAASIGVATGPVDRGDALLQAAGRAMRAAKHDRSVPFVTVSL